MASSSLTTILKVLVMQIRRQTNIKVLTPMPKKQENAHFNNAQTYIYLIIYCIMLTVK